MKSLSSKKYIYFFIISKLFHSSVYDSEFFFFFVELFENVSTIGHNLLYCLFKELELSFFQMFLERKKSDGVKTVKVMWKNVSSK